MFLIYIVKCPCVFFSQTSTYFPYFSIDICVLRSLGTGTIYWFGEGDMHEDRTQADNNEIAIVPGVGIVLILNFFSRGDFNLPNVSRKKTEPESTHEYLVFVSPKKNRAIGVEFKWERDNLLNGFFLSFNMRTFPSQISKIMTTVIVSPGKIFLFSLIIIANWPFRICHEVAFCSFIFVSTLTLNNKSIGIQLGVTFSNYFHFGYLSNLSCTFLGTLDLKLLINKQSRKCEWNCRMKHTTFGRYFCFRVLFFVCLTFGNEE